MNNKICYKGFVEELLNEWTNDFVGEYSDHKYIGVAIHALRELLNVKKRNKAIDVSLSHDEQT